MKSNPHEYLQAVGVNPNQLTEQGQALLNDYAQASKLAWRHPELEALQAELQSLGLAVIHLLEPQVKRILAHPSNGVPKQPSTADSKECDRLFAQLIELRERWEPEPGSGSGRPDSQLEKTTFETAQPEHSAMSSPASTTTARKDPTIPSDSPQSADAQKTDSKKTKS